MGDGPAFAHACMHLYCSLQSVRLHTTMYGQHSRFRMQGSSDYLLIHVRFNIILVWLELNVIKSEIRMWKWKTWILLLNNCSTYVEVLERSFIVYLGNNKRLCFYKILLYILVWTDLKNIRSIALIAISIAIRVLHTFAIKIFCGLK